MFSSGTCNRLVVMGCGESKDKSRLQGVVSTIGTNTTVL